MDLGKLGWQHHQTIMYHKHFFIYFMVLYKLPKPLSVERDITCGHTQ